MWTHWGLNPGPSACEADVIPLHHVPRQGAKIAIAACQSVAIVATNKNHLPNATAKVTPKGVLPPALCHASATLESA